MNTLKKECKKFGLLLMALAMVASFILPGASYARAGELAMLTVDSKYFTYIAKNQEKFQFEVKGLTADYQPATIDPSKVRVSSNNPSAVEVTKDDANKAIVKVNVKRPKDVVITASYEDAGVASVPCNIFVDVTKPRASNIILKVEGYPDKIVTVNKGLPIKYGAVLQNAPTALGALKSGGYNIDVSNGYLTEINGKKATKTPPYHGWKYKVNGVEPQMGCGVYRLTSGNTVEFYYE